MKPFLNRPLPFVALVTTLIATSVIADESAVEGRWLSGDKTGWIDVRLVGGNLVGTTAGATDPEEADRRDDLNPDPALRQRSLLGITILQGFTYEGDGVWKGGTIYDPNSGNTYKSTIKMIDGDTLKVRGYIGVSLFGRTETWIRDEP